MKILSDDEYFQEYTLIGMSGSAHAVSSDALPVDETIRLLHEVIKEVTGIPVEAQPKARIGFLP